MPDSNGDGRPERVKMGEPKRNGWKGSSAWKGRRPGTIWKIDGKTGAVSLFATIPGNSGPGLGDIVFDPATRQFFVSDLDTGLIHRLDSSGALIDLFDHGQTGGPPSALRQLPTMAPGDIKYPAFDSENSATWGFTQPERRVWGLGLRAGRLYYTAEVPRSGPCPSISTALSAPTRAVRSKSRERPTIIRFRTSPSTAQITCMSPSAAASKAATTIRSSRMRSNPLCSASSVKSRTIRRHPASGCRSPTNMPIGFPPDYRNTSGGLALGYGYDEAGAMRRGACDAMLLVDRRFACATTRSMRRNWPPGPAIVHGLQGNDRSLTRPDNEPPFKSCFVDYDGKSDDPRSRAMSVTLKSGSPATRGRLRLLDPRLMPE